MKKLISVIIPAYNEEACVDELARRLQGVFHTVPQYDFEVLVIENGSVDSTWDRLVKIHESDKRFKIIRLARNFRMDGGLTAGLHSARGDAAVLMTADLQDPPELIADFIKKWEEGFQNIYMVVTKRRGTGLLRRFNSRLFYWLAARLTGERLPQNASDFRLVDARCTKQYEAWMNEIDLFVACLLGSDFNPSELKLSGHRDLPEPLGRTV